MAEHAPAFQFYVRDWLGNANVRAMTPEARGVYMDLLCYCWQEGHISTDVPTLARLAGLPLARFKRVWVEVAPRFQLNGMGYRNARLDREREVQREHREKQSERGRKGALALQRKHSASSGASVLTLKPELSSSSASASAIKEVPPNPPLTRGARITKREREKAAEHRRKVAGRCTHEPKCDSFSACVELIALELRGEAVPA